MYIFNEENIYKKEEVGFPDFSFQKKKEETPGYTIYFQGRK